MWLHCYNFKKLEMIKYILPAIIILLIGIFWEKIIEVVFKKFNIRLNYIIVSAVLITITIIILLINYG